MKSRKVLFALVLDLVLCLSTSVAMAATYPVTTVDELDAAFVAIAASSENDHVINIENDLNSKVSSDYNYTTKKNGKTSYYVFKVDAAGKMLPST